MGSSCFGAGKSFMRKVELKSSRAEKMLAPFCLAAMPRERLFTEGVLTGEDPAAFGQSHKRLIADFATKRCPRGPDPDRAAAPGTGDARRCCRGRATCGGERTARAALLGTDLRRGDSYRGAAPTGEQTGSPAELVQPRLGANEPEVRIYTY